MFVLVLAFTGAPASFPVQIENRDLQRYLKWTPEILQEAETFVKSQLPLGGFIGIHLRNGIDWVSKPLPVEFKFSFEKFTCTKTFFGLYIADLLN